MEGMSTDTQYYDDTDPVDAFYIEAPNIDLPYEMFNIRKVNSNQRNYLYFSEINDLNQLLRFMRYELK